MEARSVRVSFGALDFDFTETGEHQGGTWLVGYAPEGRIGIVELVHEDQDARVSLLLSVDENRQNTVWSAMCVSSLIQAVRLDFAAWLGDQVGRRSQTDAWSVSQRFGRTSVSAKFFPADTLLITVDAPLYAASD